MRLDSLVAVLSLLLALAVEGEDALLEMAAPRCRVGRLRNEGYKGYTYSRTTMNGLPCSSFVTTAE